MADLTSPSHRPGARLGGELASLRDGTGGHRPTPGSAAQPAHPLEEVLRELTRHAAKSPDHERACAVTVRSNGHGPYTIASSHELADQLDEAQYDAEAGPCLHALREGVTVEVPDIVRERRWPEFQRYARTAGVVACLSVPITGCGATVGALKTYARSPIGEGERRRTRYFANRAGGVVAVSPQLDRQRQLIDNLKAALTSRTTIDQAIGVIMGQQRCGAEDAFALLSRAAQNRNVKLRDLAADIVKEIAR